MKTPREILLDRHRSIEPKLDDVRQRALSHLAESRTSLSKIEVSGFREMLHSLRWHLVGMSIAWVFVVLLNIDHSPSPTGDMAKENIPTPERLLAALRENHRKIAALLEAPADANEPAPVPPVSLPKRRSEIRSTISRGNYG